MRIVLLRHGETAGGPRFRGRTDDPLTDAGWWQMRAALGDAPAWSRIWTSPLVRCAGFARDYAAGLGIGLACDERLMEIDFGAWEGRTAAEIMADDAEALAAFWRDPYVAPPPGGETLAAFEARVLAVWEAIVAQAALDRTRDGNGTPLVVTHGGVVRVLLARHGGRDAVPLAAIDCPPASLHVVETDR